MNFKQKAKVYSQNHKNNSPKKGKKKIPWHIAVSRVNELSVIAYIYDDKWSWRRLPAYALSSDSSYRYVHVL